MKRRQARPGKIQMETISIFPVHFDEMNSFREVILPSVELFHDGVVQYKTFIFKEVRY